MPAGLLPSVAWRSFVLFAILVMVMFAYAGVFFPVAATINRTISFQGKIVVKTTGLNLAAGSPACVKSSAADTCDFRVRVWNHISNSDETAGTGNLMFTQTFQDVEIGDYDGIFKLDINSCGSASSGTSHWGTTTGTCTVLDDGGDADSDPGVNFDRADLYIEISFADSDTGGTLGAFGETFARKSIQSVPSALHAETAGNLQGLGSDEFVQLAPAAAQAYSGASALIRLNENGASTPDLLDLQVGGSTVIKASNAGDLTLYGGGLYINDGFSGGVIAGAAGQINIKPTGGTTNFYGAGGSSVEAFVSGRPVAGVSGSLMGVGSGLTLNALDGGDTVNLLLIDAVNSASHSGVGNFVYGVNISGITQDSDASEYALNIGAGWDRAISAAGTVAFTSLTSCTSLQTDANGVLSCGAGGGTGVLLGPSSAQEYTGANTLINLNENGASTPDLINLAVGGTSVFKVTNAGVLTLSDGTNTLWTTGDGGEYGTLSTTIGSSGGSSNVIDIAANDTSGNYSGTLINLNLDSANANGFSGNGIKITVDESQYYPNPGFLYNNPIIVAEDDGSLLFAVSDSGQVFFGSPVVSLRNAASDGLMVQANYLQVGNFAQHDLYALAIQPANTGVDFLESNITMNAMNGSDTSRGHYIEIVNANHTGAGNSLLGVDVAAITADAEATEIGMRVQSGWDYAAIFDGTVGIGETAPATRLTVKASGATVAAFNRTSSDGTIIDLQQDGTSEGTISVAGNTVSYNPFTGSHYAWIEDDSNVEPGTVMSMTGINKFHHNNSESEIIYGVAPSIVANDSAVLGSYLALQESTEAPSVENPYLVSAVGNGKMWVADTQGRDIQPGDFLVSADVVGHAMLDDELRYTRGFVIARAAEEVKWETVTETFSGVKHKLISVLYDSFVREGTGMLTDAAGETQLSIGFGLPVVLIVLILALVPNIVIGFTFWRNRRTRGVG